MLPTLRSRARNTQFKSIQHATPLSWQKILRILCVIKLKGAGSGPANQSLKSNLWTLISSSRVLSISRCLVIRRVRGNSFLSDLDSFVAWNSYKIGYSRCMHKATTSQEARKSWTEKCSGCKTRIWVTRNLHHFPYSWSRTTNVYCIYCVYPLRKSW